MPGMVPDLLVRVVIVVPLSA